MSAAAACLPPGILASLTAAPSPVSATASNWSQAMQLPSWNQLVPPSAAALWNPAGTLDGRPRCSADGTGLGNATAILAQGGNVIRRWWRPRAFDSGGTRSPLSCESRHVDTPRMPKYGRCNQIRQNCFERTTGVELGLNLGLRFEDNALCGVTGTPTNKGVIEFGSALHDLSVCGNRIDGLAAGRKIAT